MSVEASAPAGLEIRLGLPEEHRSAAAELLFKAFREKLGPILRTEEKAISALAADENLQYAITALQDGSLVGICSLSYAGGEFFDLTLSTFMREFGPLRGALKLAVLAILFRERPSKGELLVDAIVVHSERRRLGIGTCLLKAVFSLAREEGLKTVTLEVVNTNSSARRLYERVGFEPVRTKRTPYLKRFMGFSSVAKMEKRVA